MREACVGAGVRKVRDVKKEKASVKKYLLDMRLFYHRKKFSEKLLGGEDGDNSTLLL